MRGRGRAWTQRRKKLCDLGAACPYRDEHQHTSEYHHGDEVPAASGKRARTASFAGPAHRLSEEASAPGPKCAFCRRIGHNITTCRAPGVDAERRRRAHVAGAKVARGAASAAAAARPLGRGDVVAPSPAIPAEFLSRQQARAEPPAVRQHLRDSQNATYAEALERDRQTERERQHAAEEAHRARLREAEDAELARVMEASVAAAAEERRVHRAEARARLEAAEPLDGDWLRLRTPFGTWQRRFRVECSIADELCPYLLARDELAGVAWAVHEAATRRVVLRVNRDGAVLEAPSGTLAVLGLRNAALILTLCDEDD